MPSFQLACEPLKCKVVNIHLSGSRNQPRSGTSGYREMFYKIMILTLSFRLFHCLSSHPSFPAGAMAPCERCFAVSSQSKATAQGPVKDARAWSEQMPYANSMCNVHTAPAVKPDHATQLPPPRHVP